MISTISETFFNDHLKSIYDIQPLKNLLSVEVGGGHTLQYLGYVELAIQFPKDVSGEMRDQTFLLLVVPDTPYNLKVPICIGTNIIKRCRQHCQSHFGQRFMQTATLPKAWYEAYRTLNMTYQCVGGDVPIPVTSTEPVTLEPDNCMVIHGLCQTKGILSPVLVEPSEIHVAPSGVLVMPEVKELSCHDSPTQVDITVYNVGSRPVTIPKKMVIAELHAVERVDSTSMSATSPAPDCDKLGINLERTCLNEQQLKEARTFFENWRSVFSLSSDDLGHTDLVTHNIKLTSDTPFKERARRLPPGMYEEVKKHLRDMLDTGIIRESKSPWASNIVCVRKKDGTLRLCVDFRRLNNITIKDSYALPRIEETLDSLAGAKIFSTLDLRSGYWQVEIDESDKEKTAFVVDRLGFYECNRMAFGLTNAPATFQRLMEHCLRDLSSQECCIYLDDVIVFSNTVEEHIHRLDRVFNCLKECGLTLKPSKCCFFQECVKYLGHIISADGICTDPEKTEALRNWPVPSNIKELRQYLGFTGYYRRFIEGYAKIAKPLTSYLQGSGRDEEGRFRTKPIEWTPAAQQAFDRLNHLLSHPPILAYADYSQPFELHTDASGDGLGAVLYQTQNGEKRVIAYASRGLKPSEKNYSAYKLEYLALKWAVCEKYHDYLYGQYFDVYTDNNPLTYLLTSAKLDATGHRWLSELACYNFAIHYRAGKANIDADALSRIPHNITIDCDAVEAMMQCHLVNQTLVECVCMSANRDPSDEVDPNINLLQDDKASMSSLTIEQWKEYQSTDPIIGPVLRYFKQGRKPRSVDDPDTSLLLQEWDRLCLKEDVLYRKRKIDGQTRFQIVLPSNLRERAIKGLHDENGHLGIDRVMDLIRSRFYWPRMYRHVKEKIMQCERCIRRKSPTTKRCALLGRLHSSFPMDLLCMDYLSLEASKGGYGNILVLTDHFTRYAVAIPTRNQTAKTTARVLFDHFLINYGFPARIHTDQGRNFESELIKHLCKIANIKKTRTTPYHPQGNGQCERFNQTLLHMLGTLTEEQKSDWKSYVPSLVHAYNATKHDSTGYSPFYLMYGRSPRLPIDVALGIVPEDDKEESLPEYAKKFKERLCVAYDIANSEANKAADKAKQRFDLSVRNSDLQPGDRVLVKNVGFTGKHKLADKWEEQAYIILEKPNPEIPVYVVRREDGKGSKRTLHRNMLLSLATIPLDRPSTKLRPRLKTDRERQPDSELTSEDESDEDEAPMTLNPLAPEYVPHRTDAAPPLPVREDDAPTFEPSIEHENTPFEALPVDDEAAEVPDVAVPDTDADPPVDDLTDDVPNQEEDHQNVPDNVVPDNMDDMDILEDEVVEPAIVQPVRPPRPVPRSRPTRNRRPPDRYGDWEMGSPTSHIAVASTELEKKIQLLMQVRETSLPSEIPALTSAIVDLIRNA